MFRADDYSRDEVKAITDKVLNMAKADAVEVNLTGGERSGTRWANSSITDEPRAVRPQRHGDGARRPEDRAAPTTRDFSDAGLQDDGRRSASPTRKQAQRQSEPARSCSGRRSTSRSTPRCPTMVNFGPAERARMVKDSIDLCEKMGVLGAGLHPEERPDHLQRELEGPVRVLPRRRNGLRAHVPHGRRQRIGLGRHHGHQGRQR